LKFENVCYQNTFSTEKQIPKPQNRRTTNAFCGQNTRLVLTSTILPHVTCHSYPKTENPEGNSSSKYEWPRTEYSMTNISTAYINLNQSRKLASCAPFDPSDVLMVYQVPCAIKQPHSVYRSQHLRTSSATQFIAHSRYYKVMLPKLGINQHMKRDGVIYGPHELGRL